VGIRSEPRYLNSRAKVLAASDICGICGHPGAITCDHIVPLAVWPRDAAGRLLPGHDAPENLMPAHGTAGPGPGRLNRCLVCGQLCNQVKKASVNVPLSPGRGRYEHQPSPHSRDW
jgi:hypothetical protein